MSNFIKSTIKSGMEKSFNFLKLMQLMKYLFLVAITANSVNSQAGSINISQFFENQYQITTTIEPTKTATFILGEFKQGDKVGFQALVSNKMYHDITVCLVQKSEINNWRPGNTCFGQQKTITPFVYQTEIVADDTYYLVVDNSYANIIKKFVTINVRTRYFIPEEKANKIKQLFQGTTSFVSTIFEDSDFNVNIKPCGQINAFSDKNADITFCTEMLDDLLAKNDAASIISVFLHELGHSLLNKWGEPGSGEEDMADQFATALLLKGGDQGRGILRQWIEFWSRKDSKKEAELQLKYDDPHSLSIQRARNIQNNMLQQDEFLRRWNKMLYRHMRKDALLKIVEKPGHSDDADLASEALKAK